MFLTVYVGNCFFLIIFQSLLWLFEKLFILVYDEFRRLLFFMPQTLRELFNTYDDKGYKHNLSYLQTLTTKIATMPLSQQAQFADWQTINGVKNLQSEYNPLLFDLIKTSIVQYGNLGNLTTTGIGNMAYIALHLPATKETNWFANDCFNLLSNLRSGYYNTWFS
jgi:hypothetical protein